MEDAIYVTAKTHFGILHCILNSDFVHFPLQNTTSLSSVLREGREPAVKTPLEIWVSKMYGSIYFPLPHCKLHAIGRFLIILLPDLQIGQCIAATDLFLISINFQIRKVINTINTLVHAIFCLATELIQQVFIALERLLSVKDLWLGPSHPSVLININCSLLQLHLSHSKEMSV